MDSTRAPWMTKVEDAIRTLRHVAGVSGPADGEDIREIHVLTTSSKPAKQIVRDIQSLLAASFNQKIDHRVVSVAYIDPAHADAEPLVRERERAPVAADEPRPEARGLERATASDRDAERGHEIAHGSPSRNGESEPAMDDRVRFVSANLYVSGPRVQAEVELRWRGTSRTGSASGWSTRDGAHRLVASAAIAAVQEYLADGMALSLEGIEFVHVGRQPVVVVALELIAHRDHRTLVGGCSVGEDRQQAIVLATLAALNRVIPGLPVRESVEMETRS